MLNNFYFNITDRWEMTETSILRKQQGDRTICKIRNSAMNEIETCPEKIQQCFQEYYKILYSQPQASKDNQIDAFLSQVNLQKITREQNG